MPSSQKVQLSTLDTVEYLPVTHAVQVVAPVLVPVLVLLPAAQVAQPPVSEAARYFPAPHAVQAESAVLPVAVPVS